MPQREKTDLNAVGLIHQADHICNCRGEGDHPGHSASASLSCCGGSGESCCRDGAESNELPAGPPKEVSGYSWRTYAALGLFGLLFAAATALARASFTVTDVPDPVAFPAEVAAAADGKVWFTEARHTANNLVRRATDGTLTKYAIPTPNSSPGGVAVDPSGKIWLTEMTNPGKIAKFDPGSASWVEYPVPVSNGEPYDVATSSSGNVWYSLRKSNHLGVRFADGSAALVNLPAGARPHGVAVDKAGNVWAAATGLDRIYEWTTGKTLYSWQLAAGSGPIDITVDDAGNIWFTERDGNKIGRILPTGVLAEYNIPSAGTEPFGISVRRQGISGVSTEPVWFARNAAISSVNACGLGDELLLNTSYEPVSVAVDPNGDAWGTDIRGNRLVRNYAPASDLVLNASTAAGAAGSKLTLAGTLKMGSTPVPNVKVRLWQRGPGSTGWSFLADVTTNSVGYYGINVYPTRNTAYRATYGSNTAISKPCVEVAPTLSAKYSDKSLKKGERTRIYGKLNPGHAGGSLYFEKLVGASWTPVSRATANSKGKYSFYWRPPAGTHLVRMTFKGDADHRPRSTPAAKVTVK